jgi:hypothetical protein
MNARIPTNRPQVTDPETDPRTLGSSVPWSTVQAIARDLRAAVSRIAAMDPRDVAVHPYVRAEAARVACSLLDALISWRPMNGPDVSPRVETLEREVRTWRAVSFVALVAALLALVEVVTLAGKLTP